MQVRGGVLYQRWQCEIGIWSHSFVFVEVSENDRLILLLSSTLIEIKRTFQPDAVFSILKVTLYTPSDWVSVRGINFNLH